MSRLLRFNGQVLPWPDKAPLGFSRAVTRMGRPPRLGHSTVLVRSALGEQLERALAAKQAIVGVKSLARAAGYQRV